jgi:hypothetical protein
MTNEQSEAKKAEIIAKWIAILLETGYVEPNIQINNNPAYNLTASDISITYTGINNLSSSMKGVLRNKLAFENDICEKVFQEYFDYLVGQKHV